MQSTLIKKLDTCISRVKLRIEFEKEGITDILSIVCYKATVLFYRSSVVYYTGNRDYEPQLSYILLLNTHTCIFLYSDETRTI